MQIVLTKLFGICSSNSFEIVCFLQNCEIMVCMRKCGSCISCVVFDLLYRLFRHFHLLSFRSIRIKKDAREEIPFSFSCKVTRASSAHHRKYVKQPGYPAYGDHLENGKVRQHLFQPVSIRPACHMYFFFQDFRLQASNGQDGQNRQISYLTR